MRHHAYTLLAFLAMLLAMPTYTIAQIWEKVTNTSQLSAGDIITFVDEAASVALGKQKTNNFDEVSIVVTDGCFTSSEITSLTLVVSGKYWAFQLSDKNYLCAYAPLSGTKNYNYLKSQKSITDASKATISIDKSGNAEIKFNTSDKYSNIIRHNKDNIVFSCYLKNLAANQQDIQLYRQREDVPVVSKNISAFKALSEGTTATLTLQDAQVLKVHKTTSGQTEVFVRDTSGAICFSDVGFTEGNIGEGNVLNGTITGTFTLLNAMPEMTSTTDITSISGLTITQGEQPLPKEVDGTDLGNEYYCDLITIKDATATVSSNSQYIIKEDHSVLLFDRFGLTFPTPYDNANLDVTGICIPQNETKQICPFANTHIVYNFDEKKENVFGSVENVISCLRRTLSSEYWNTFCCPFSISASQVSDTFGAGTVIARYTGDSDNTMNFELSDHIETGVAYLLKPAKTVANPVFSNVSIVADTQPASSAGTAYLFNGVFSPTPLDTATDLFIAKSGNVSQFAEGKNTINGLRAYIRCTDATSPKPKMNFAIDVTNIDGTALTPSVTSAKVFNLHGQCVGTSTQRLPKGIYVSNGKKFVVR